VKVLRNREKLAFWNRGRQRNPGRGVPAISQQPRSTGNKEIRKPVWPFYGEIGKSYRQRQNPAKPNPGLKGYPDRASDGAAKDVPAHDYQINPKERAGQTKPQVETRGKPVLPRNKRLTMFPPSAFPVYSGPTAPVDEGDDH